VIFGSNTINVIRKVNCTTLIIPENYKYAAPKEMLLALDPFDKLNGKAIRNFFKFFKHHTLRLHVLRINPHNDIYGVEADDKQNFNHSEHHQKPREIITHRGRRIHFDRHA